MSNLQIFCVPAELPVVLSDPPGLRIAGSGDGRGQPVAARNRHRHRIARPRALPWATIVLLTFALVNIVLARMLFAWLERWLAQRRTREILGIFFFLFILSFQLIGPLIAAYEHRSIPKSRVLGEKLTNAQRPLPPGLAAAAIAGTMKESACHQRGLLCSAGVSMGSHSSGS